MEIIKKIFVVYSMLVTTLANGAMNPTTPLTIKRVFAEKFGALALGTTLAASFICEKISAKSYFVSGALGTAVCLYSMYRDHKHGSLDAKRALNHCGNLGMFIASLIVPCMLDASQNQVPRTTGEFVRMGPNEFVKKEALPFYQQMKTQEKNG